MQAGQLRKRILIQQRSTSVDSFGAQVATWTDVITLWCEIAPATGKEMQAAQAVQQELTHTITTRWPGAAVTITPAMRGVYNGRVFNITGVANENERNRMLTISAVELLNQG